MTRPTVSVCMPVSRDIALVRRALRSVLTQDLHDIEVLIGDESGAAEPLVAEFADRRVDYHRNPERLGFTANHRALLDRAAGTYMAVVHDDDWWEPTYLSALVKVLDADPAVGMACSGTSVDFSDGVQVTWPVPIAAGKHAEPLDLLLREEWFLLPISTVWRREVWSGPARQWPELCCADLQFFMSAADAGWGLHYVPETLAHWTQHPDQSGAWRGSDQGLGVAQDVLAFWDSWLAGRPDAQVALTARQRARWYLRQARALILAGRSGEARIALREAARLRGAQSVERGASPNLFRLQVAARLPTVAVRIGIGTKRAIAQQIKEHRARKIGPNG